jgi:hypothetical protein
MWGQNRLELLSFGLRHQFEKDWGYLFNWKREQADWGSVRPQHPTDFSDSDVEDVRHVGVLMLEKRSKIEGLKGLLEILRWEKWRKRNIAFGVVFEGVQELVFRVDMDIPEYKFCGFDDTFDDAVLTFFRERHKIFRHIFDFLLHYAQSIFIHYSIEIDLSLCPISIKIQKKGR